MTQGWAPPREARDVDDALWLFQQDLPVLKKDRDGQVGNQRTKYADLTQANEVVLTRLNALDCIWVCEPRVTVLGDQMRFVLGWELRHVPSGTKRTGDFPILGDSPMKHGAAITYARRYSLLAVTGVIPEDEDDDSMSFNEQGHSVARRAASGRARTPAPARRPAGAEDVEPPARRVRDAAPPLPGEEAPPADEDTARPDGLIRPEQTRRMMALWGDLGRLGQTQFVGENNRSNRIAATQKLAGRPDLTTSTDLTSSEADVVIGKLEARRDAIAADQAG